MSAERPGGWVDGIGWVALVGELASNDEAKVTANGLPDKVRFLTQFDRFCPVIVVRWSDGTTPQPRTDLREALQAIANLNPANFMDGQGHLTPAFRTPNTAAAIAQAQQIASAALAAEAHRGRFGGER